MGGSRRVEVVAHIDSTGIGTSTTCIRSSRARFTRRRGRLRVRADGQGGFPVANLEKHEQPRVHLNGFSRARQVLDGGLGRTSLRI